jgi:hypothetical protein
MTLPYTQETGLPLYRLITGRTLDEIKPFFASDAPYRGTYSGASGIFTAERPDLTSAEVLGFLGFDAAPAPSYLIHYQFSGSGTYLDRVENPIFQEKFLSITGTAKHEFAQDCRFYLETAGHIAQTHALVWNSASGSAVGAPGYTYLILPPYSGALLYTTTERVG